MKYKYPISSSSALKNNPYFTRPLAFIVNNMPGAKSFSKVTQQTRGIRQVKIKNNDTFVIIYSFLICFHKIMVTQCNNSFNF